MPSTISYLLTLAPFKSIVLGGNLSISASSSCLSPSLLLPRRFRLSRSGERSIDLPRPGA
jgi:hypothetical protein